MDSTQPADRPTLVVLCASDTADARPSHLEGVERSMRVRYADAAGLPAALEGAQALFVWDFFSAALRPAWGAAGDLRWIHVAAAGVDTLLFDELVESDVTVTNARGVFDRPIAEFVLMGVLMHVKDAARSLDLQRARTWRHRETATVAGRTALVIGTGAIGRETARLLRAAGLQVRGAGRTARASDPNFDVVVASSDLAAHVGWADHVVVVAPLTAQTRGLVDARVLAAMKPTAQLVNVGRGPCVVEDALIEALRSGTIAGAWLDVFDTEPLPPEHPLWTTPGVVVTPHLSGDVVGWRDELARQFVANAERYLAGLPLLNVIDKRLGFADAEPSGAVR